MVSVAVRQVRKKRTADEITAIMARRGLSVSQRLAIHALTMTTSRSEALQVMRENGINIDSSTMTRWFKNATFRMTLKLAEAVVAESITKHSVLRKSEAALNKAMEGIPVLGYVEKDRQEIVGYRPDLPSAARLIEMQGKAVGLFQDENATRVAVLIDIDFSGRKDTPTAPPAQPIEDAVFAPVPTDVEAAAREVLEDEEWLG